MSIPPVPPTDVRPASRLAALDGLRLVAALAVMGFHYTAANVGYWGRPSSEVFPAANHLTRYGYLGVELFFVISGFVILMTAYGRPLPAFVASRFSRLFPAYWVAVLATVALQQLWSRGRGVNPLDALVNLTMIQQAFNADSVQGAFWTLWYELKFYLLIGIFIVVGITRARVLAFAFLWPLIGSIGVHAGSRVVDEFLMPDYAPYFAAGMLIFVVYREGHNLLAWLGIGFNLILCVRQALAFAVSNRNDDLGAGTVDPVVVGGIIIVIFAVVITCVLTPLSRLSWRWLTLAGALTYPVYLVHGQFGFFVIDVLHQRLPTEVVLVLAALTSLALAFLIHRLVERPFARPLRRAVERALTSDSAVPSGGDAVREPGRGTADDRQEAIDPGGPGVVGRKHPAPM